MIESVLTEPRLTKLRAEAHRATGESGFIDPVLFRAASRPIMSVPEDWLERVAGGPIGVRSQAPFWVRVLALRASQEDVAYLTWRSAREVEAATARMAAREAEALAARAARLADWRRLQSRLPVHTFAAHNWTLGHYDGHVAGADHIVVLAQLDVGRLHRADRQALCETPSRSRSGTTRHPDPLRALAREPNPHDDADRVPTCCACLNVATRLAGPEVAAPTSSTAGQRVLAAGN